MYTFVDFLIGMNRLGENDGLILPDSPELLLTDDELIAFYEDAADMPGASLDEVAAELDALPQLLARQEADLDAMQGGSRANVGLALAGGGLVLADRALNSGEFDRRELLRKVRKGFGISALAFLMQAGEADAQMPDMPEITGLTPQERMAERRRIGTVEGLTPEEFRMVDAVNWVDPELKKVDAFDPAKEATVSALRRGARYKRIKGDPEATAKAKLAARGEWIRQVRRSGASQRQSFEAEHAMHSGQITTVPAGEVAEETLTSSKNFLVHAFSPHALIRDGEDNRVLSERARSVKYLVVRGATGGNFNPTDNPYAVVYAKQIDSRFQTKHVQMLIDRKVASL